MSNVFLRPKSNGKHRMIIDLSDLNEHITKIHFKMDHLDAAINMVYEDCYFTSIDLQDAYYSVPIANKHQGFLAFVWNQKFFKFGVLPFGLTSAPRVFTKLLKPVFSTLRQQGIDCLGYIDDCLIVSANNDKAVQDSLAMSQLFVKLGFKINEEKSSFEPSTEITFLGYVINSVDMTVKPTATKVEKCKKKVDFLLQDQSFRIREVAEVIGILVDLCKGVEYGSSHYRHLEKDKVFSLRRAGDEGFDGDMFITHKATKDLSWWKENVDKRPKKIRPSPPTLTLTTDASEEGWGAVFQGVSTGGRWSTSEISDHINVLELRAVLLGLKTFVSDDHDIEILVKSDNTTTISYINRMGGMNSPQCNKLALQIWEFCEIRNIWLVATFIPGVLNVVADFESRHFTDDTEWELCDHIFHQACLEFGYPEIDLFASRLNAKCNQYVSWKPDPDACHIDAFTLDWSCFNLVYVFPPFRLVGRCIQKMRKERAKGLIVAPDWSGQTWYTGLMNVAQRQPLRFRGGRDNIIPESPMLKRTRICQIALVVVLC